MQACGDARGLPRVKRGLLLLLAVACVLGFVRLGVWQLHRADYKEALLAHSRQVLTARKAESLAAAVDAHTIASDDGDYTWTSGQGHFLGLPAVLLDNQSRGGRPGVRVYRVFQPDGGGHAVLLELGWRALPLDRKLPAEPSLPGQWQIQGLLAPPPAAGINLGGGAIQRQPDGTLLLTRLEPSRVAASLALPNGLAPRVLRLDPALPLGYARDLDVLSGALPPEQHRGYAVQWFAMAAGLLVASIVVARRKSARKMS
jgi:surfeit locus 1 family protein